MSYNIPDAIKGCLEYHRLALLWTVRNAVHLSFLNADRICAGRAGEVDKVLQFFIDGTAIIEDGFNRILVPDGINVSIAAIFTHQTPYVEFQTGAMAMKERCELADICILSTYGEFLDDPASGLGNAIFLQAKDRFVAPPNDTQRQLYEHAREFQYSRPQSLRRIAPDHRDLPPKTASALAYWELEPHLFARWSYAPDNVQDFSETLVDFLAGECGYGFREPKANEYSWSRIIFDLVQVTACTAVTRELLKVRRRERGIGTVVREMFRQAGGAKGPFVVRNSLAKTLSYYSRELGDLGAKIEEAPNQLDKQRLASLGGDSPGKDGGDGAPPLGNSREYDDDDGGGGNLILIHFSRRG